MDRTGRATALDQPREGETKEDGRLDEVCVCVEVRECNLTPLIMSGTGFSSGFKLGFQGAHVRLAPPLHHAKASSVPFPSKVTMNGYLQEEREK